MLRFASSSSSSSSSPICQPSALHRSATCYHSNAKLLFCLCIICIILSCASLSSAQLLFSGPSWQVLRKDGSGAVASAFPSSASSSSSSSASSSSSLPSNDFTTQGNKEPTRWEATVQNWLDKISSDWLVSYDDLVGELFHRREEEKAKRTRSSSAMSKGASCAPHCGFVFVFTHQPSQQLRNVFEFTGNLLASFFELQEEIPVLVQAEMMPEGILAGAAPTRLRQHPHNSNEVVVEALYRQIAGPQRGPAIDVVINTAETDFYYGLDGRPSPGKLDLVTVLLHELSHGMGFASWIRNGNPITMLPPLPTYSLPPHLFYAFDERLRTLVDEEEEAMGERSITFAEARSTTLGLNSFAKSQDVVYESPSLEGHLVHVYSPSNYMEGSSLSHWDEHEYPPGDANALMTPYLDRGEVIHHIGGFAIKAFQDLGFVMRNCSAYTTCQECVQRFCRWCSLEDEDGEPPLQDGCSASGKGRCGDPRAAPFFNHECESEVATDDGETLVDFDAYDPTPRFDASTITLPSDDSLSDSHSPGEDSSSPSSSTTNQNESGFLDEEPVASSDASSVLLPAPSLLLLQFFSSRIYQTM
ncbi:T9SS type A sorting domain-containing protein [Balamuthia mandrillaris]